MFAKVSNSRSHVWRFFKRNASKTLAQCDFCNKTLKIIGGSTKSLSDHLRKIHNISSDEDFAEKAPKFDEFVTILPVLFTFISIKFFLF